MHFTDVIPPDSVIALGDCHGQYELLKQFVNWVKDSGSRVIFLGDLCDRQRNPGDDLKVIELVREMCEDPDKFGLASCTCLVGNHEVLALNAMEGYGYMDWVNNGGEPNNLDQLKKHEKWLRSLPYYVTVGETLFSHSGGIYGEDPAMSMYSVFKCERFVWSRTAYRMGSGLAEWSKTLKKSVFGHSPKSTMPYIIGDAICIDTGAYTTGVLTAYNATYNMFTQFEEEV